MVRWERMGREQEGRTFVFRHYGLAPAVVFRNPNLSVGAKALYGHLATFVNGEQMKRGSLHAWPSRERIMKDLNISVNTFGKYLKELKDASLIEVQQVRRTLEEGRQAYGNNLYILQTHINNGDDERPNYQNVSDSKTDPLKSCDSQEVNISSTRSLSSTRSESKINVSTTYQERGEAGNDAMFLVTENSEEEQERELSFDVLLKTWNDSGVNQHHKLGENTQRRIQVALREALEDYSAVELLATIKTYAEVYKDRRCKHKYRLVEFLEKRGYEHFLVKENWKRNSPRGPVAREDFRYSVPEQDLSQFAFLYDDDTDVSDTG